MIDKLVPDNQFLTTTDNVCVGENDMIHSNKIIQHSIRSSKNDKFGREPRRNNRKLTPKKKTQQQQKQKKRKINKMFEI